MTKTRSVVWGLLAVAAVLLVGCRRDTDTADAARVVQDKPPGTPAQAVLIAPEPSELDESKGRAIGTPTIPGHRDSFVSLTEESEKGVYHIALQDPYAEMYDVGEGMIVRVRGGGARREPGSPDIGGLAWVLPGKVGYNLMPTVTDAAFASATQGVDIAAIAIRQTTEDGVEPTFERQRAPQIYEQDALFPSHVVKVQEVWVGTNKLVRLEVNPVQYNPVTRELRLCYRLKAKLEYVKSVIPEDA